MTSPGTTDGPSAESLLRDGRLDEAMSALKGQIRAKPQDAKLRVFLLQLQCFTGEWSKALTQANVAGDLDASLLLMVEVARRCLECEAYRREVFAGTRTPLIFGEPSEWMGRLVEAARLDALDHADQAETMRGEAFEAAPSISGTIDGQKFEWIADADPRLGPAIELMLQGQYYWSPLSNIHAIEIDEPTDLRDAIWAPATFTWSNGGQAVGFVPARYPGSEHSTDDAIRLARKTEFEELGGDRFRVLGQRMFATDAGEFPLLACRRVELDTLKPDADAAEIVREMIADREREEAGGDHGG